MKIVVCSGAESKLTKLAIEQNINVYYVHGTYLKINAELRNRTEKKF